MGSVPLLVLFGKCLGQSVLLWLTGGHLIEAGSTVIYSEKLFPARHSLTKAAPEYQQILL